MTCPNCEIELEDKNFLVMAFLKGNGKYWCPECGHKWKFKKKWKAQEKQVLKEYETR